MYKLTPKSSRETSAELVKKSKDIQVHADLEWARITMMMWQLDCMVSKRGPQEVACGLPNYLFISLSWKNSVAVRS